jgi:hypothetical protein
MEGARMNIQDYKRGLLELETRLSARTVGGRERARAQVLDSAGDTADASVADLAASEDFTEAELDATVLRDRTWCRVPDARRVLGNRPIARKSARGRDIHDGLLNPPLTIRVRC